MRVLLDIPDDCLKNLGKLAKGKKHSRKAYMELILINEAKVKRIIEIASGNAELGKNDIRTPINTNKPPKKKGESSIDYSIRLAQWRENKQLPNI